jgi:hypothetical protein
LTHVNEPRFSRGKFTQRPRRCRIRVFARRSFSWGVAQWGHMTAVRQMTVWVFRAGVSHHPVIAVRAQMRRARGLFSCAACPDR